MKSSGTASIWVDIFWKNKPGIGRVHEEILKRMPADCMIVNSNIEHSSQKMGALHPWKMGRAIRKSGAKVYFSAGYMPPFRPGIPGAIIIHDLIHRSYGSNLTKLYYDWVLRRLIRNVKIIFTDSQASRERIFHWAKFPPEKIIVLPLGVDSKFAQKGARHAPGFKYLICVGNRRPHKNIPRLLKAFAQARISPQIKLLFSGHSDDAMEKMLGELHITDRVAFAGKIPEQVLPAYYRGSLGLVMPSLEEGFGLPIIEAQACGVPVLTSNCSSMIEVSGKAAFLCDPESIESIREGIENLITNRSSRERYIRAGSKNIRRFSWDKTAEMVFREISFMNGEKT